jgi:hypothetical protein
MSHGADEGQNGVSVGVIAQLTSGRVWVLDLELPSRALPARIQGGIDTGGNPRQ